MLMFCKVSCQISSFKKLETAQENQVPLSSFCQLRSTSVPKTIRSLVVVTVETIVSNATWVVVVDANLLAYVRAAVVPGTMSKWTKTIMRVGRIP
jgi:hypothetical protein